MGRSGQACWTTHNGESYVTTSLCVSTHWPPKDELDEAGLTRNKAWFGLQGWGPIRPALFHLSSVLELFFPSCALVFLLSPLVYGEFCQWRSLLSCIFLSLSVAYLTTVDVGLGTVQLGPTSS